MKKITIIHDGERITHMASQYGNYATICGLDGDDPRVGQVPTTTDPRAKIDCDHCKAIWEESREFKRADFKWK